MSHSNERVCMKLHSGVISAKAVPSPAVIDARAKKKILEKAIWLEFSTYKIQQHLPMLAQKQDNIQ